MKSCLLLLLILGYSSEQIIIDEYEDDFVQPQKNFNRPINDYDDDYVAENHKRYQKPTHVAPPRKEAPPPSPLIVKQINEMNQDGSYTFGYQSEDGSYRVETRNTDGHTRGKYGYVDAKGELKEVEYTAGSTGYVPSGDHIQVPPPAPPPRPEVVRPKVGQGETRNRATPQKEVVQDYDIDYEDDLANIQSNIQSNIRENSNKNYDERRSNKKEFSQRREDGKLGIDNNAANGAPILELSIEYPNAGRVPTAGRIPNVDRILNEGRIPNGRRQPNVRIPNGGRNSNLRNQNGRRHPDVRIADGERDLNARRNTQRRGKNQFVGTSKNVFEF